MHFEKARVDLYYKEQGSFPSILQSEATFLLPDCAGAADPSLFHVALPFPEHLAAGALHDTHAERTRGQSDIPPLASRLQNVVTLLC